jgi:membrane protease YdiL (CAAX protease family)
MLVAPARTAFLLLAQAACALVYVLQGAQNPWRSSTAWWTVYGTLADLGCLSLLLLLTRREGTGFRSLFEKFDGSVVRTLALGAGYFLFIMPLFLGGSVLSSLIVYGSWQPHVNSALLGERELPRWAAIYSVAIWWIIWSPTEELFYQAYLLKRVRAWSERLWPALLLVGFWWAIQHSALPFIPDAKYLVWRFLGFLPGVLALMAVYIRTGRILPLILAHWPMDLLASSLTIHWR